MTKQREIARVLSRIGDLPAMPEVVAEVLSKTDDPSVAMSDVSAIIERDPALTAKLLKVSNSPYYGMKQVVGTLKLALVILGVREVRNIVVGISVVDSLRDENSERLLTKRDYWSHSVMVGALAKRIGTHFKFGLQGEDFIAGLLHDIGKIVLWRQLGRRYETIYTGAKGFGEALCEQELATLGFDHADAAGALALRWNLPSTLGDAMLCHHMGEGRELANAKDPILAALVRVSNLAAHDDWKTEDPATLRCINDEASWEILLRDEDPMEIDDRHALILSFWEEIKHMPVPAF